MRNSPAHIDDEVFQQTAMIIVFAILAFSWLIAVILD